MSAPRLSKGQRAFYDAVATGSGGMFHRCVIEAVERLDLVVYHAPWRLVGCNSFSARDFALTEAGRAMLEARAKAQAIVVGGVE